MLTQVTSGETVQTPLFDAQLLSSIVGIAVIILIAGFLFIIKIAFEALGISVPQEVIDKIIASGVATYDTSMQQLETATANTPTPIDDLLLEIAKGPMNEVKMKFLAAISAEDILLEFQNRSSASDDSGIAASPTLMEDSV